MNAKMNAKNYPAAGVLSPLCEECAGGVVLQSGTVTLCAVCSKAIAVGWGPMPAPPAPWKPKGSPRTFMEASWGSVEEMKATDCPEMRQWVQDQLSSVYHRHWLHVPLIAMAPLDRALADEMLDCEECKADLRWDMDQMAARRVDKG